MRRTEFERLYVELHPAVSAYVVRRLPAGIEPGDIVAEVFTVVWRRLDDLPPPPADRLWVFGVARRCVSHASRSLDRRNRLHARLANASPEIPSEDLNTGFLVREAIAGLPGKEAEALRLVAWDGLTHQEAAHVLGCSTNAVAIRVHRARKRLALQFEDQPDLELRQMAGGGAS